MSAKKNSKKQAASTTQRRPAKRKVIVTLAQYEAEAKAEKQAKGAAPAATESKSAPRGAGAKSGAEPTKDSTGATKRPTGERGATQRGLSGLDAAAQVLGEAGEPLNTKEMVDRMLAQGLWKTGGRTPASTIYAAILRECATKGDKARFRKVARGKFELAK